MKTKDLRFSQNWNGKLNCNYFTTIRPFYAGNYAVGQMVNVFVKGKKIGMGIIEQKHQFILQDLPSMTAALDTGYNKADTLKMLNTMYKKKFQNPLIEKFEILLIKRVKTM